MPLSPPAGSTLHLSDVRQGSAVFRLDTAYFFVPANSVGSNVDLASHMKNRLGVRYACKTPSKAG